MTIEFNEKDHTYLVDNVPTPSVTQLVAVLFPDTYKGVSKRVLEKASAYGTKVHEIIENAALKDVFPSLDKSYELLALNRFKTLQNRYEIHATSCEQHVAFVKDGCPWFAGTYDMVGTVKGKTALIDIKTTQAYHSDLLPLQLGMYKMAIEQMEPDIKIEECYCLWLPKKALGNLIPVNVPTEEELFPKVQKAYEKYFA